MKVLVLGGTRFVGRHVVEAARASGHEVSVLHRGKTGRALWPDVEDLIGDRNTDMHSLAGDRRWDAVIDSSAYVPSTVRASLDALSSRVEHYTFVSTISVYDSFATPGVDENSPVIELPDTANEEVTEETYGGLKVMCEREVHAIYPDALVVRPGIVAGPLDYTDRFPYWVDRIARGGTVACPAPPDAPVQFIDGRDLGNWIVAMVEKRASGTFNAVGPGEEMTFGDLFARIKEVTASDAELRWVDEEQIRRAGLAEKIPLWVAPSETEWRYMYAVDASRARAKGLTHRAVDHTVRDTLGWVREERADGLSVGPSADEEGKLLRHEAEVGS
jgi:2'-hydroxyisoflavone reductase